MLDSIYNRLQELRFADFLVAILETASAFPKCVAVRRNSSVEFPVGEVPVEFGEAVCVRLDVGGAFVVGHAVTRRIRKACERLRELYGISHSFSDGDTLASLRGDLLASPETPRALPEDVDLVLTLSALGAVFGPLAETYEFLLRDGLLLNSPYLIAERIRSTIA